MLSLSTLKQMPPDLALKRSKRLFAWSGLVPLVGILLSLVLGVVGGFAAFLVYLFLWYMSIKLSLIAIKNALMSSEPDDIRSTAIENIIGMALFPIGLVLIILVRRVIWT